MLWIVVPGRWPGLDERLARLGRKTATFTVNKSFTALSALLSVLCGERIEFCQPVTAGELVPKLLPDRSRCWIGFARLPALSNL